MDHNKEFLQLMSEKDKIIFFVSTIIFEITTI